jgi:serine/threonine protein kinase
MSTDSNSIYDEPEFRRLADEDRELAEKGLEINFENCPSRYRDALERVARRARLDRLAPWECGRQIAEGYEVQKPLGRGGMGEVYLVKKLSDGKRFAAKRAVRRRSGSGDLVRELFRWVSIPSHPNIARCEDVQIVSDEILIFVEYVAEGSLNDWINGDKRRLYNGSESEQQKRIVEIAVHTVRGLAWIHGVGFEQKSIASWSHDYSAGIVHQDIKPDNILIASGTVAKITDFGLSRTFYGASGDRSALVERVGWSKNFRSPEQSPLQPRPDTLTTATDIWSWAATVLAMFFGGPVWGNGEEAACCLDPGGVHPRVPIPRDVRDLLQTCLDRNPNRRPSAKDLAGNLKGVYEQVFSQQFPESDQPQSPPSRAAECATLYIDEEANSLVNGLLSREDQLSNYVHKSGWHCGAGNYRAASDLLERASEVFRDRSATERVRLGTAFVSLGRALSIVGRLEEAKEHLEKGIDLLREPVSLRQKVRELEHRAVILEGRTWTPRERLELIVSSNDVAFWRFPPRWAEVDDITLRELSPETRTLLIARLAARRNEPWKGLCGRLRALGGELGTDCKG